MIDLENDAQVLAAGLIAVLGAMAFFQAGLLSAGNLGLVGADSKRVMEEQEVREKVQNYVSVTSGDRVNASVTGVERSDRLESFYRVGVELKVPFMNQTRTQKTTVFVSRDGEYIMSGKPQDLDNPQQPEQSKEPGETTEGGNRTQ